MEQYEGENKSSKPGLPIDLLFGAVDKGGKLLPGGVADEHRHILPHDEMCIRDRKYVAAGTELRKL